MDIKKSKTFFAPIIVISSTLPALSQTMPSVKITEPMVTNTTSSSTNYPTVMSTAVFTSKLKGLTVYNQDSKSIGEIEDIAINANYNVDAYIVSVGGVLGMGEHYVAISPSAVDVKWDVTASKWSAKMSASVEQIKSAPEFKYPK